MTTLLTDALLVLSDRLVPGWVLTEGDRISRMGLETEPLPAADRVISCEGAYLSPGFLDIHTHGAGGCDYLESREALCRAGRMHLSHGTTSLLPTTLAGSPESLREQVELFEGVELEQPGCPHFLGLHLEGPYLSPAQAGAQNPAWIRCPDPAEYRPLLEKGSRIRRWTFAPELSGGMEFLDALVKAGVQASLGHSSADCRTTMAACDRGLSSLSHFYSCMDSVRRVNAYRVAGAIEAGYLRDDLTVEVIADGHHLPDELLQLIWKVKGPDRICLVTDSMNAAGMPDGPCQLGGLACIKEDGVAKLADRSAFAGSVATTDQLLRVFRRATGAPLWEVVRTLTATPARLLGLSRKGKLAPGMDADLVVFDEDVQMQLVMVSGQLVWQRGEWMV